MGERRLTAADLARWAALAAAARPGPWSGDETGVYDDLDRKFCVLFVHADEEVPRARADAALLAASRAAVPALVATVRELAAAIIEADLVPGCSVELEGDEPAACAFCGDRVRRDGAMAHERGCPVLRARALLGDA